MERAFTAYLDNTPNNPEGAGIRNWVWNAATQTGKSGGTYAQAFNGAVYYKVSLQHFFSFSHDDAEYCIDDFFNYRITFLKDNMLAA